MTKKKTWFITGASRGFGLNITKAVLDSGDRVVATVRSGASQLEDEFYNDKDLLVLTMDVTRQQEVNLAVEAAIEHFGQIDVLVNNAGYGLLAAVEEGRDEEVRANYEVNVFGTLNVIRAVLPYMRGEQSGHIINISSVGGLTASAGWGLYGSTKFAIEGITEALSAELSPLGIHATVVAPGRFRTNFLDQSSLLMGKNEYADYAQTVGKMRRETPDANRRQAGDPAKLAKAFLALAASEKPPVHLLLGQDTISRYRAKAAALEQDISDWYEISTSTDHEDLKLKNI